MPQFEDLRLVRGAGRYTDDVSVPARQQPCSCAHRTAMRRIVSIDVSAACGRPGVLAVLTGADYVADGHLGMAHFPNPADAIDVSFRPSRPRPSAKFSTCWNCRSRPDAVRYVGEAVAVVVAESLVAARDAAEAVVVEYDTLPAVTDVEEALSRAAPALWPDAPGNLALDNTFGDRAAVDAAMAGAHLVVEQTVRSQRTVSAFMEPRAALGSYDKPAANTS